MWHSGNSDYFQIYIKWENLENEIQIIFLSCIINYIGACYITEKRIQLNFPSEKRGKFLLVLPVKNGSHWQIVMKNIFFFIIYKQKTEMLFHCWCKVNNSFQAIDIQNLFIDKLCVETSYILFYPKSKTTKMINRLIQ